MSISSSLAQIGLEYTQSTCLTSIVHFSTRSFKSTLPIYWGFLLCSMVVMVGCSQDFPLGPETYPLHLAHETLVFNSVVKCIPYAHIEVQLCSFFSRQWLSHKDTLSHSLVFYWTQLDTVATQRCTNSLGVEILSDPTFYSTNPLEC